MLHATRYIRPVEAQDEKLKKWSAAAGYLYLQPRRGWLGALKTHLANTTILLISMIIDKPCAANVLFVLYYYSLKNILHNLFGRSIERTEATRAPSPSAPHPRSAVRHPFSAGAAAQGAAWGRGAPAVTHRAAASRRAAARDPLASPPLPLRRARRRRLPPGAPPLAAAEPPPHRPPLPQAQAGASAPPQWRGVCEQPDLWRRACSSQHEWLLEGAPLPRLPSPTPARAPAPHAATPPPWRQARRGCRRRWRARSGGAGGLCGC